MREGDPIERVRRCLRDRFGLEPAVVATAPGRVNLIGEHVDHRGGVVLPCAIDRRIAVAMAPAGDGRTTIAADDLGVEASWPGPPPTAPVPGDRLAFANHVLGVIDALGGPPDAAPLSVAIAGNLPIGGGLSSSAALEVATGLAIAALRGRPIPDIRTLAEAARRTEHDWVGTPCGLMDMLASAGGRPGRVLRIDCASHAIEPLPAPPTDEVAIVLLDSGVRHRLADGGYASRLAALDRVETAIGGSLRTASLARLEATAMDPTDRRRGRHVVTEMARVEAATAALLAGDLATLGDLMFRSHASLRDDFGVSTPELDRLVEAASRLRGSGVLGARMTGGGFGGWVIGLVARRSVEDAVAAIGDDFESAFGRRPDHLEVRPADGARIEHAPGRGVSYPRGLDAR